jgi:metallo-beta-lactamase class B
MRLRSSLTLFLAAVSLFAQTSEWTRPFPPLRIVGNVYYVGTYDLACYLIVTPQGNILINTGLADSAPQIQANIEKLGYKLADTKILTATHAHFDHVAAMAEMQRRTGAEVWATEPEAALLESGGKTDFRFGDDPGARFAPVRVDRKLKDGEKLRLGGTELTVLLHPGHTRGAASFSFTVREAGRDYRVLIANMGSINPGVVLRHNPKYPEIAQDYARTFRAQKAMTPDIWLASHASQFGLHSKYQPGDAYNPDRFVDPAGYHAAVERLEKIYLDQMGREK